MAIKKKIKNKLSKAKKTVVRKSRARKKVATKKPARRKVVPKKKVASKKPKPRRITAKKKPAPKKTAAKKVETAGKTQSMDAVEIEQRRLRRRSVRQSGDLQGLPHQAEADSESVDELLEEGNAFEAGIVLGIEEADGADEDEVVTHEVLADDVPGEYLDED